MCSKHKHSAVLLGSGNNWKCMDCGTKWEGQIPVLVVTHDQTHPFED